MPGVSRGDRGLATCRCELSIRRRPGSGTDSAGRGDFPRGVEVPSFPASGSLNRTRERGDLSSGSPDTSGAHGLPAADEGSRLNGGTAGAAAEAGDIMTGAD